MRRYSQFRKIFVVFCRNGYRIVAHMHFPSFFSLYQRIAIGFALILLVGVSVSALFFVGSERNSVPAESTAAVALSGETAPGNANALCLYNATSELSKNICDYYGEKRPGVQKLGVAIPNSAFTDGVNKEQTNGPEFLRLVVKPLYEYIDSHPELNITHIAAAKDIPIRIVDTEKYLAKGNDFMQTFPPKTVFASSNFLLSIQGDYANATNLSEYVLGSAVTVDSGCVALKSGLQSSRNLEYQKAPVQHFDPDAYKNKPYASNPRFAVSFLSGYALSDIKKMIDKAQLPAPSKDKVAWVFDLDSSLSFFSEEQNQKFRQDIMESAGAPRATIFSYSAQTKGKPKQYEFPIIGYWGFGIYNPGYNGLWIAEDPVIRGSVVPRALLTSLESWNAHTLQGDATHAGQETYYQGKIADAFAPNAFGGANYTNSFSGAVGNVYEPTTAGTAMAEALFSNYAAGLTFGETVLKSFRYLPDSLYSVHIAVGDPLMRAFDEPVSARRTINFGIGNTEPYSPRDIATTGGRKCYNQPTSCIAQDGTVVADGVGICADAAQKKVCRNGTFSVQTIACEKGCSLGQCVEDVFTPPNKLMLKKDSIYPLVVPIKTVSNKISDIFRQPPHGTDVSYKVGSMQLSANYLDLDSGLGWVWSRLSNTSNDSAPNPDILPGTGMFFTPKEDYEVTLNGQPFTSGVTVNIKGAATLFGIPFCGDKYTASQALREVQAIEPRCKTIINNAQNAKTFPVLYWGGSERANATKSDFKLNNYEAYVLQCEPAVDFVWKPSCSPASGASGVGDDSAVRAKAETLLNRLKEIGKKINGLR